MERGETRQPDGYPDEINYDFGLTDEAAGSRSDIVNGEANWTLDPPPPDRLVEIGTKFKDQVHVNTLTAWWYARSMWNIPPLQQRESAAGGELPSSSREALVTIFSAARCCTAYHAAAGIPWPQAVLQLTQNAGRSGRLPDGKGETTRRESGTAGQEVTVVVEDSAIKSVGTYLQSVLSDLGYKASVKPISSNIQFTYIQNKQQRTDQRSQWYQDYPAASNFLNTVLGCNCFQSWLQFSR